MKPLILTSVIAKQVVVFLRTTRPTRALFLTMQYGTPIFLQRAGRKRTSWNKKEIFNNDFSFLKRYSVSKVMSEVMSKGGSSKLNIMTKRFENSLSSLNNSLEENDSKCLHLQIVWAFCFEYLYRQEVFHSLFQV